MPFIFVLVVRPSIKRKTFEYFWDYKWYFFWVLIIPFINIFFIYMGIIFIRDFMYFLFNIYKLAAIFFTAMVVFVLPLKIIEIFFYLFWLDSRLGFKNLFFSLWRAIKMFMLNLPVYLILFVLPYLLFMFLGNYFLYLFGAFWPIFMTYLVLLAYVFYTCFLVNFYTKNIHDKFIVYFKE